MASTYINGYTNSNRSAALIQDLNELGYGAKTWEGNAPGWCETAEKMRFIGKVIIALSIVLAAFTIAGSCYYQGDLLIGIATSGSIGTVIGLGIGILLLKKAYWQDPAYLQERREKVVQTLISDGYGEAKSKYGSECTAFDLVTQQEIGHVMMKHHLAGKTYRQLQSDKRANLHQLIQDGVYHPAWFTDLFLSETNGWTLCQILDEYGWQPIEDGVLPLTPLHASQAEHKLNEAGFRHLIQKYGWNLFKYKLLTKDNHSVQMKFLEYLNSTAFTETCYTSAAQYDLIPELWKSKMGELHTRERDARNSHSTTVARAKRNYNEAVSRADNLYFFQTTPTHYDRHGHRIPVGLAIRVLAETTRQEAVNSAEHIKKVEIKKSREALDDNLRKINEEWVNYCSRNPIPTAPMF